MITYCTVEAQGSLDSEARARRERSSSTLTMCLTRAHSVLRAARHAGLGLAELVINKMFGSYMHPRVGMSRFDVGDSVGRGSSSQNTQVHKTYRLCASVALLNDLSHLTNVKNSFCSLLALSTVRVLNYCNLSVYYCTYSTYSMSMYLCGYHYGVSSLQCRLAIQLESVQAATRCSRPA